MHNWPHVNVRAARAINYSNQESKNAKDLSNETAKLLVGSSLKTAEKASKSKETRSSEARNGRVREGCCAQVARKFTKRANPETSEYPLHTVMTGTRWYRIT